jgi:cell division protein FtsB
MDSFQSDMSKKVGFILAALVTVFFGYNLIAQITSTLKQADKLQSASQALFSLELKNKELKDKLSEVKSPEFVEKEARDKLGLAREGETVIIIPDDKLKQVLGSTQKNVEAKLPNWLGWWQLFF